MEGMLKAANYTRAASFGAEENESPVRAPRGGRGRAKTCNDLRARMKPDRAERISRV